MREFLRGAVRLHILHHAAAQELNGVWIAEELGHHGYKISSGTLYPTLHRMEEEGLLSSRKELRSGRLVRLYRATDLGRVNLDEQRALLAELANEVLEQPST
jgi:DNA-binding PadR family transcriptional regulator